MQHRLLLVLQFLSTLSLRRATKNPISSGLDAPISIHALLAESDTPASVNALILAISIHALLAESDMDCTKEEFYAAIFLSTLSLRRATLHGCYSLRYPAQFLSTLSLRRATRANSLPDTPPQISIHALLAESDAAGVFPVILII